MYHFESVADVNDWDDGKKLKLLKVRLTGKAQTAFQWLPEEVRADYKEAKKALRSGLSQRVTRAVSTLNSRPVPKRSRSRGQISLMN